LNKEQLEGLWQRYKTDDDQSARDELIVYYSRIVQAIVRRMMPKYNTFNEFEDLVHTGIIGLINAIERFEPERGLAFETYATVRIRGEILDYMRAQDWASPNLRHKISNITKMFEELEAKHQRPATEYEVAISLDMPLDEVRAAINKSHIFNLISFESTLSELGTTTIDVADDEEHTPENILLNKEFLSRLAVAVEALPERERLIITLYYFEGFLLKDIANLLEVTEGRVSQIHSRVLAKIKKQLVE
jgi:RNA polymerase sigma factor for flagellar operon FliA